MINQTEGFNHSLKGYRSGCRCVLCRSANSEYHKIYQRQRRARQKQEEIKSREQAARAQSIPYVLRTGDE